MKKISFLIILSILFLSGCSNEGTERIEGHTWIMSTVQSTEREGQAVACGERGVSSLPDAVMLDLRCKAGDSVLTLTDRTNGKVYTGIYRLKEIVPNSVIYEITLEGREGLAVIGPTSYHDGSTELTLIINLNDYVLNFYAETQ